jgi:membrane protein implicated in regulation of membrane protease activity
MNPPRPAAARGIKLLGVLVAGHGGFVLLKLLGIAGIVTLLGALGISFGTEVAGIALLHVAAIVAVVVVFRRRHRSPHGSPSDRPLVGRGP